MIKFDYLIHKKTRTVIKYEEWYKSTRDYLRIGEMKFNPRDVLFSDDFEIIYNSEFTYKEIESLYLICMRNSGSCENLTLKDKLLKQLNNKYYLDNPKLEKMSDNLNKIYKANGYNMGGKQ